MFYYDYTVYEGNHFYDCIYIKSVNFLSLSHTSQVYLVFNKIMMTPYTNKNNDFVCFEFKRDAEHYINTCLWKKNTYSTEKVMMYHIYAMISNSKNLNSGITIKKHNKNYWACMFTYVYNCYLT